MEKDWDGHSTPKILISCIANVINIINFQEISCEYIKDILANHNGIISITWDNNRYIQKDLSFYVINKDKRNIFKDFKVYKKN